jgi:hypothetical protein
MESLRPEDHLRILFKSSLKSLMQYDIGIFTISNFLSSRLSLVWCAFNGSFVKIELKYTN